MDLYKAHHRKAMRDIPAGARPTDTLWLSLMHKLELDAFRASFSLDEQGRFGLGYYHQKREFVEQAIARRPPATNIGTTDNVENLEEIKA